MVLREFLEAPAPLAHKANLVAASKTEDSSGWLWLGEILRKQASSQSSTACAMIFEVIRCDMTRETFMSCGFF